jgi:two-component system sensor histidine kinase KdpD
MRWLGVAVCLAGIVTFYRLVVHANQTTVALTLLLLILFIAANLGLRYAIVTSIAATACYNFFFLPPVDTFTVSDPQNLLALIVFLITSVFASRMSNRIRAESLQARCRQAELEVLYSLSWDLLQTGELIHLANAIPASVARATNSKSVLFYLLDGKKIYHAGLDWPSSANDAELRELSNTPGVSTTATGESIIPLRTGVRPRGLLILSGVKLSNQTLEAIGGLVTVSLDRESAVENVAHTEATKESERFRSLILDSITQELRTPLTSIKGATRALLTLEPSNRQKHELLSVIDEESDRLNHLISEAIEMAQLDSQEASLTFTPQDVAAIIEDSISSSVSKISDHEVVVRIGSSLPKVNVDPTRVQKVFTNLLENAAKFSESGQPIFVSAEAEGHFVSCSIADRGIGIDASEQGLIFDRLYRSKNRPADAKGAGMGLAICRAIIEAHGGKISVTSQLEQGSVFTFTLPAL